MSYSRYSGHSRASREFRADSQDREQAWTRGYPSYKHGIAAPLRASHARSAASYRSRSLLYAYIYEYTYTHTYTDIYV